MMTSIHAVKFNHIRHHKYCLTDEDYEGKSAGMTWYGAILYGPVHMFLIHKVTLQIGNKDYRRNVILGTCFHCYFFSSGVLLSN